MRAWRPKNAELEATVHELNMTVELLMADNNNLRARLEDINATLSADEAQNAEPQSA